MCGLCGVESFGRAAWEGVAAVGQSHGVFAIGLLEGCAAFFDGGGEFRGR
jgi:hypothetical protein